MLLQLQLKYSITFIIGREDHGFTVFSEEILYGILALFTFYSMLLFVLATVMSERNQITV